MPPPPPGGSVIPGRPDPCLIGNANINSYIFDIVLYPLCAVAGQLQLRVGRGKIIVTLCTQLVAYWSQVGWCMCMRAHACVCTCV